MVHEPGTNKFEGVWVRPDELGNLFLGKVCTVSESAAAHVNKGASGGVVKRTCL